VLLANRWLTGVAYAATLVAAVPGFAAAQVDSIGRRPLFTVKDAAIFGAFATATLLIAPLDTRLARELQDEDVQTNRNLGKIAAVVRDVATPGSVVIGISMYGIGRATRNERLADLGLHGTEALAVGQVLAEVLKGVFGRARPLVDTVNYSPHDFELGRGFRKGTEYRSFPSGHTISAFAAAAAVSAETARWWPNTRWIIGPILYTGAAAAGVSRMYHNRHWASDVLMGAAFGTMAGLKVVQYHHSRPGNPIDRWLLPKTAAPAPDGGTLLIWTIPFSP
jgi:membrane-associated phospholipid phosphatase